MSGSLTARFFNQVDRLSQERGRRYFLRGAVSFIEGSNTSIHAGVQGTRLYDVDISIDKRVIDASCTCPFFERELDPCKHIWAALLAAEQSGFLAALEAIPAPHLRGVAPKPASKKMAASRGTRKICGRRAGGTNCSACALNSKATAAAGVTAAEQSAS